MCLKLKDISVLPKKSKHNRICYKVIRVREMGDGKMQYTTPYRYVKLDDDILSGAKPFVANNQRRKWTSLVRNMGSFWLSYYGIEDGYIHAFRSLGAAQQCANNDVFIHFFKENVVVYRCEIPAGTEYFEGVDNDICARQIVFKECVYKRF